MKIFLMALAIFIAGCASSPVIYNPKKLNNNNLIKVTTLKKASFFDAGYNTWIKFVWDVNNKEITKRNEFFDNLIGEISLPSGKYKFEASCVNGQSEANPKAIFNLVNHKKYQIYCQIGKGENIFGMTVDSFASLKIKEIN